MFSCRSMPPTGSLSGSQVFEYTAPTQSQPDDQVFIAATPPNPSRPVVPTPAPQVPSRLQAIQAQQKAKENYKQIQQVLSKLPSVPTVVPAQTTRK